MLGELWLTELVWRPSLRRPLSGVFAIGLGEFRVEDPLSFLARSGVRALLLSPELLEQAVILRLGTVGMDSVALLLSMAVDQGLCALGSGIRERSLESNSHLILVSFRLVDGRRSSEHRNLTFTDDLATLNVTAGVCLLIAQSLMIQANMKT